MLVSEVKTVVDLLKDVTALARKAENYDPELVGKLNALQGHILDFQARKPALAGEADKPGG